MRFACPRLAIGLMPAALLLPAMPALADVKAGVDAWARGDFVKAVAEWRGPAAAGDADAQFNLGQAYKLGRGVPIDLAIAQGWYRKAAAQGHAEAEDNLGLVLFQDGRKAEALPWLERAAARDERRAEVVLGTMLFNGDGIAKDWTRAYALVTRSSQQGLPQGSQTLAQMDQFVPPEQKQAGIAMAKRIEADTRSARLAATARSTTTVLAQGNPAAPRLASTASVPAPPTKAPPRARPAPATAVAAPTARPTPGTGSGGAGGGGWRIQLGAFRDEGNARALWAQVGSRTGGTPSYVRAGAVTRLQATGFPTRSAAQSACTKARVSCVVVAP